MPDFQTAIIRVIIVGTLIIGVGFTGLYFVFRSFDDEKNNNQVFAVVPANTNPTACTNFGLQTSGCILVFAHVPAPED